MRNLILTLLIASTAMPAVAQDRGMFGRQRDRSAQSSDDSDRPRPQRSQRAESRSEDAVRPQRAERQRAESQPAESQPAREQRVFARRDRTAPVATQGVDTTTSAASTVQVQPRDRRGNSIVDSIVDMRRVRTGEGVVVNRDTPTRTETRRSGDRQWSDRWRSDNRYDWRRYRDRNRSVFRFGSYYDPYGYGYRRFSIGFNIWPSYYQSSYWLNDPWMYRLPPAYGPYRWVRYWDDALLVNIYTGQVVDVVHDFFW